MSSEKPISALHLRIEVTVRCSSWVFSTSVGEVSIVGESVITLGHEEGISPWQSQIGAVYSHSDADGLFNLLPQSSIVTTKTIRWALLWGGMIS